MKLSIWNKWHGNSYRNPAWIVALLRYFRLLRLETANLESYLRIEISKDNVFSGQCCLVR